MTASPARRSRQASKTREKKIRKAEVKVRHKIEAGRADVAELAQRAAQAICNEEDLAARKLAIDGPPEPNPEEVYGIVAKKLFSGPAGDYYVGAVIGSMPGHNRQVEVSARSLDGLIAMCHREHTAGLIATGMERQAAQNRVATFYIATVL